jgi:hypothetical protein
MFFGCFNSSSFFCLGIILVLIGILGYLISRKFQEQNLKITTMCDLVTTMAQDLQMLKMQNAVDKLQHTLHNQSGGNGTSSLSVGGGNVAVDRLGFDTLGYLCVDESNKIVVSDDEESYDDADDADEDDDDENNESILEDFDDMGELEELVTETDDIEITEISEPAKPEIVNIEMSMDGPLLTKHIEITIEPEALVQQHNSEQETQPHIIVSKLDTTSSPISIPLEDTMDLSTNTFTDSLLSNVNKPKKTKPSRSLSVEESGDSFENLENFNGDYSKLNVTQLRKIVTDRGLSTHATKLKKTELLQLLGSGVTVVELENVDI